MPRRRNSAKKVPQHRNRAYGSVKGAMRQFNVMAPQEVFDFFDALAIDERGQLHSRGEILLRLVKNAKEQVSVISTTREMR